MIYGVPCCDGEEDNPIITEEKVISNNKQYIYEKFNCALFTWSKWNMDEISGLKFHLK